MRLVAAGPVATAYTSENLNSTYGGRLSILERAATTLLRERRGSAADR
jgi:hypothetical protein